MKEITLDFLRPLLRQRPADGHKGTFGQTLIIAGQWGMAGASVLAARSCLRSGVGKVCVCIPRRNNDILQTSVPEAVLLHDISEVRFSGAVDVSAYDAVAIGPGLGTHEETAAAFHGQLLRTDNTPLVLDADALNILARHPEWADDVPDNAILTPHGGELERLRRAGISLSRFVTVMKGHPTLILPPHCPQEEAYLCPWGGSGMATAGSGDVLTGIIAALLAQGHSPLEAALLGVSLHALAGDAATEALTEYCVTASSLTDYLPAAFSAVTENRA